MKAPIRSDVNQQGIVLVVAMIMLLLLTLVGTTAMHTTSLEEKMAGNANNRKLAFEASESSLRGGENWLADLQPPKPEPVSACSSACGDILYVKGTLSPDNPATWTTVDSPSRLYGATLPGVAAPQLYVEYDRFLKDTLNIGTQADKEGRDFYAVTSRGTGGNDTAVSMLRSSYARRF